MIPHPTPAAHGPAARATACARAVLAPDRTTERGILGVLLVQHRADGATWRSHTPVERAAARWLAEQGILTLVPGTPNLWILTPFGLLTGGAYTLLVLDLDP